MNKHFFPGLDSFEHVAAMEPICQPDEIARTVHDRRERLRFPIDAELRWQVSGGQRDEIHGTGKAENISSKYLAFRADGPLITQGMHLSLSLAWPAKIAETPLLLAFDGTVLRTRANLVVISIEHPEFRCAW